MVTETFQMAVRQANVLTSCSMTQYGPYYEKMITVTISLNCYLYVVDTVLPPPVAVRIPQMFHLHISSKY